MERKMLVVLDFDGTLADTRPIIVASMQRTLAELHLPERNEAQCAAVIGLPLRECFTALLGIDDELGERCAEVYRRIFDELNTPGFVRLFPGVLPALHQLHAAGITLSICSSRGKPTLTGYVSTLGLSDIISLVVSADDVSPGKPSPAPVQYAMRELGFRPEQTLVVGDADFDIAMGRAAGCHTCGATYGNQSAEQLLAAGAESLIGSFGELPQLVRSRMARMGVWLEAAK